MRSSAVPCETWIQLEQRVEEAIGDLVRQQKSLSEADRTPAQIAAMQALQDALFEAIAAIQQHEKEHGCEAKLGECSRSTASRRSPLQLYNRITPSAGIGGEDDMETIEEAARPMR